MTSYISRLHQAIKEKKTPALVGLDPRLDLLPKSIIEHAEKKTAGTYEMAAFAFEEFCQRIIDVVAPLVPAVKPQAAFFEQYGASGMMALQNVIQYARSKGLIVICDAKRGDIGSTAEAYAQGFIAGAEPTDAPWGADALTVNPYLGKDTLEPFVKIAHERGGGIYVLVKTSNPGAASFQNHKQDDHKLFETIGQTVEELTNLGELCDGYGSIGAVVGATYPEELQQLRYKMPHVPLLVPGYGSQGGTSADVAHGFDSQGLGALVNSSRGINFAYLKEPYLSQFEQDDWEQTVLLATNSMIEDFHAHTTAAELCD